MLRIKRVVTGLIIAAVCLLSCPTAAPQSGPQSKEGTVSDDDFVRLQQEIKELKNPTFRAFLRMRLLSWNPADPNPTRRQAAMQVATQGITDLCEHQEEVWAPTALWLHASFVKEIKALQSAEETAIDLCVLKTEPVNTATRDFSSGIKMLKEPETSAAGLELARSAILNGRVSADTMLGPLVTLQAAHSPHVHTLLSAVLLLEEKQPGTLPLRLMPFYSARFLEKSVPPELLTRWMVVAVRASRVSAEQMANPIVRGPISELLNGIAGPAQRLMPSLYPEIASRLGSLGKNTLNTTEARLAAEERIQKATDQLEQLISEANSASDEKLKNFFLFRAARMARDEGQLTRAVDLAIKAANNTNSYWLNEFLLETVSLAVKKKSPREATYTVSKMTPPLDKAKAFRLLGEYYGANQEHVKSKQAFSDSARQLASVDNGNEKVETSLLLAESVLKYEPAEAYEVFREAVKAVNNLPSPNKDQEKMYYLRLLPIAEDLIRSFRLLSASETQAAANLAAEIKLSELRLSAVSGAANKTK